jgi:glycosyltransferase involved in cell wall biosynthesis
MLPKPVDAYEQGKLACLKILQVTPEFPPHSLGGGGLLVQNLVQGLRKQGNEVTLVTGLFEVNGILERPFSTNCRGIMVIWLPLFPAPNVGFQLKTITPPNPFSVAQLLRVLMIQDFDIVHIHGFGHLLCDYAAVLCRVFGKKYVLTIHGFPKEPRRRGGLLSIVYNAYTKTLGAQTIRHATKVVAVSSSIAKECHEYAPDEKIAVIRNAVDTTMYSAPPSAQKINSIITRYNLAGSLVILCVGRLSEAKGFQYAIRALPVVRKAIPNVRLVIVGKDDGYGYFRELKKITVQQGIEPYVSFVGGVNDEEKNALLWTARVVAIPSVEEPFGIVALEAMASGRIVVASKVGGLQEILSSDKYSFLVESKNVDQLAQALIKVITDENMRIGAREDRFSRSEQFDLRRMISEYIDLYHT